MNRARNLHTDKEVSYIKTMLRFVRMFETTYPHFLKRELLMDRILFPENRAARITTQGGMALQSTKFDPKEKVYPETY